jgi:GNAT superfamily N-acetyltransferase
MKVNVLNEGELEVNGIVHLIELLEERQETISAQGYDDYISLITYTNINPLGVEIELSFSCSNCELQINMYELNIDVKIKETGEKICEIKFNITFSLFDYFYKNIYFDCDDISLNMKDCFENIFFCDDDDFKKDSKELINQKYDEYMDYNNCPAWIHLDNINVENDYRGMGYGQAILKYFIELFGINNDYEIYEFYSTKEIIFSVYPYPVESDKTPEINEAQFDSKLKKVQQFYKKIGFKNFQERGYFILN